MAAARTNLPEDIDALPAALIAERARAARNRRDLANVGLLMIGLAITACAPTLHPITPQPAIVDSNAALRFCLDYMRQAVPASGLAQVIAMAGPRQVALDRCLAAQGWTE